MRNAFFALTVLGLGAAMSDAWADEKTSAAEEVFVHRVLPLLKQKCFACHGDDVDDVRGQLNMLTREGLLKGGESGQPAVIVGKPGESPLYLAVTRTNDDWPAMPPKENDRLTAEQVEYLKQWIAGGAPWPSAERIAEIARTSGDRWNAAEGVKVVTSGGLAEEWTNRRYKPENLWAYQPLRKDEGGRIKDEAENLVDRMIDRRLAE